MKAFTRTLKTAMPTMLLFASLSGVTTMSYADSTNPNAPVSMTDKWDKTFAESQKVDHRKVSFPNRYGITLVGDLYLPKDRGDRKLAAIAVSGPFGAVKEQSSGWGGMALNDVAMDTRVKAVATSVMYDMSRAMGHGVGDGKDRYSTADRRAVLQYLNEQRWQDAQSGTFAHGGHDINVDSNGKVSAGERILPETLPANPHPVLKEFFDYYRMPRGFHERSVNSTGAWTATMPLSFMNMPLLSYASEITIPTLIVTGEKAHSRYFAEDAYKAVGSKDKELVVVPGANHVDLYDNVAGKIPFAKFEQFFQTKLK